MADSIEALERQLAAVEQLLSERQLEQYVAYPKQLEFHAAGADPAIRERLLIAGNQLGKQQPVSALVLTPTGWRRIGDLKVGDPIIAGDGTVTNVTGVFPQGVKPVVEVEFCYGAKVRVGPEHLWLVQTPQTRFRTTSKTVYEEHAHTPDARVRGRRKKKSTVEVPNPRHGEWEVLQTQQMREKYGDAPSPKYRYATPHVGACQFNAQPTPVDPYLLGLLLGDGCLRTTTLLYSSLDDDLVGYVRREVEKFGGTVARKNRCDYAITRVPGLVKGLKKLGLFGCLSNAKRVPQQYLWNTPEVRLAVLQGLMDTDGTCEKSGVTTFTSVSEGLAEDVQFLARSFGGKTKVRSRVPTFTHKGEKRTGQRAYTVTIRLPHVPLFRLQRKLARYVRPVSTSDLNLIVAFRDLQPEQSVCISVAHPSRLYVTDEFIVTHNTLSASREAAMHLTGAYPAWWPGKVFHKKTAAWAGSKTSGVTRDSVQRYLLGRPGSWGTGAIPKDRIVDVKKNPHGVPDAVEMITVKHIPPDSKKGASDGNSVIAFKSYDQEREKWQGETLDFVWFDEEPPLDIYTEGLTRTNATKGIAFMTFTPLLGISEVVKRFLYEKVAGTHVTTMTIEDALHYTAEERARIIATYPAHEREARTKGIPMLGSGAIFPFQESEITEGALQIPDWWPRVAGMDFGFDHPTAVVWLAWDRDTDTVHVYDCYKRREASPAVHAAVMRSRGLWIPVMWPHDGNIRDGRGSGETLAQQYRGLGANMFVRRATHPPEPGRQEGTGTNSLEASIADIYDRFQTGRLKINRNLKDLLEEVRLYHRKDGKVEQVNDDAISAMRTGLMMLRHAVTAPRKQNTAIVAPWAPTVSGMGMG